MNGNDISANASARTQHAPTVNALLAARGFTTRPVGNGGEKLILWHGEVVFRGFADETGAWLGTAKSRAVQS